MEVCACCISFATFVTHVEAQSYRFGLVAGLPWQTVLQDLACPGRHLQECQVHWKMDYKIVRCPGRRLPEEMKLQRLTVMAVVQVWNCKTDVVKCVTQRHPSEIVPDRICFLLAHHKVLTLPKQLACDLLHLLQPVRLGLDHELRHNADPSVVYNFHSSKRLPG
jgi:hypothetical protein